MDFFWEKSGWENEDKHILALRQAPFRRAIPEASLDSGLHSLRGPRQIGKSSYLKTWLSRAVKSGARSYFLSCDEIRDYKELREYLNPILSKTDCIFLDEITFVEEWWRCIKKVIDDGFKGAIFVTGSNAFDLRRGFDQMPGRWAKSGGEHIIYPMNYAEWVDAHSKAGWTLDQDPKINFENYFKIGGIPAALIEAGEKHADPVIAKKNIWRWILGDVLKRGRQELYLTTILGQLAQTMGSRISLHKLAQKIQIMSYNTAGEYIQTLEDCYALRTLYALDPNTGNIQFKKEKKYYFSDPLIYWMALEVGGINPPQEQKRSSEVLAEAVAHEQLYQKMKFENKRFGYFSSIKGEIDFFRSKEFAIEVKWSLYPSHLSKAYLECLLPNKKVWSIHNFLT